MAEEADDTTGRPLPRYAGFISYSQKDKGWARRIHKALEAYRLPTGLPGDVERPKRLGRFFRDDDELAGAPSLGAALEGALEDSGALIVICSPNSARSKWVDAEVRHFKQCRPDGKVLAVIVAGRPDTDDPELRCFPPSLLRKVAPDGTLTDEPDEPLAPDVSKDSFPRLIARLAAGLIGVEFDALWRRERRRRRRRNIIAATAALAIVAGAVGGAIAVRNAERDRLEQESTRLAAEAQVAMDEGRRADALDLVTRALPADLRDPDRPVVPTAVDALRRLMTGEAARGVVARFDEGVDSLRLLDGGKLAARLAGGAIVAIDAATGEETARVAADRPLQWLAGGARAGYATNDERQREDGTWSIDHTVRVHDVATGRIVRDVRIDNGDWWFEAAISPSGRLVAAKPTATGEGGAQLAIFDTGDGSKAPGTAPVHVGDAPFVDFDSVLRMAFLDETTLAISWGEARRGLALWHAGADEPVLLSAADAPAPCDGAAPDESDRRDMTSLSLDGRLLTHARPVGEDGWCVSPFRSDDGSALPPILFEDTTASGIVAVTERLFALPLSSRTFLSRAEIRDSDGTRMEMEGCSAQPARLFSLRPDAGQWIVRPDAGFAACIGGGAIPVGSGPTLAPAEPLRGHDGAVRALAFDAESRSLWSGGEDGTVRLWRIAEPVVPEPGLPALLTDARDGRVAAMFRERRGGLSVRVFSASGEALSPRTPFPLDPAGEADGAPQREVALRLLSGGETLAVAEGFRCSFGGCPPGFDRRLTLLDGASGEPLARFGALAAGPFLSAMPVALETDASGRRMLLLMADGGALIVDPATGETLSKLEPPADGRYVSAAFAHGGWWLLGSDEPQGPEKRTVRLLRADADTPPREIVARPSQDGRLFAAPDGSRLLAWFSGYPGGAPKAVALIGAGEEVTEADPGEAPLDDSIENVLFAADGSAVLFFGDLGGAPVRAIDGESGEMTILAPRQPASTHDGWRVEDPLRRAALSTGDDALSILPFDPARPLCPGLSGRPAEAAAISADGKLLAVASDRLVVFDLESCTPVLESTATARDNAALAFADARRLWVRDREGRIRILDLDGDPETLLAAARRLAASYGK